MASPTPERAALTRVGGSPRRVARKIGAITAIVIAAVATIATSPAPFDASAELELQSTLSDEHPIDVRIVDITIEQGDDAIDRPLLTVQRDYSLSEMARNNLWVSIVPLDPAEPVRVPVPRLAESLGDISQDLTEYCRQGCKRSYYIVTQRPPGVHATVASAVSVEVTVRKDSRATGARGPRATVEEVADDLPERTAYLSSTVTGALDADAFASTAWRGEIRVPRAGFDAGTSPMFGSLAVFGRFDVDGGDRVAAHLWVGVNGEYRFGASLTSGFVDLPVQREWLSSCDRQADCVVPIDLELRWSPPLSLIPEGGHVHFDFTADARLAYLGLSEPPAGADLQLTAR